MRGNVLLINDRQIGGGAETVVRLEKELLKELGFKVFTLTFDNDDEGGELALILKPNKSREKVVKFFGSKKLSKIFDNIVTKLEPKFIHLHLISKYPLVVYKSPLLKSIKVIQTLHGPNLFCASGWGGLKNGESCELGIGIKCFSRKCVSLPASIIYTLLIKRYLDDLKNKVDVFHCPSMNILQVAKKFEFKKNIFIPLCIEDKFLENPKKIETKRPTILFAGALEKQKGAHLLVPIMLEIIKSYPDALMKIAGVGLLMGEIKNSIENHNLKNNFETLGFINSQDMREFYCSGDVFLMPSVWHEQFGLVGPEALSCKVPVVATDVGGISEWLTNGENGYLVSPNDVTGFSKAITNILGDHELKKSMGDIGRDKVINNYSSSIFKEKLKGLIKTVMNE